MRVRLLIWVHTHCVSTVLFFWVCSAPLLTWCARSACCALRRSIHTQRAHCFLVCSRIMGGPNHLVRSVHVYLETYSHSLPPPDSYRESSINTRTYIFDTFIRRVCVRLLHTYKRVYGIVYVGCAHLEWIIALVCGHGLVLVVAYA